MVTYQIEDNLRKYLKSIGLSIYKLENDCGFSRSYLTNVKFNVPAHKIDVICERLPDLNKTWLMTGEGKMTNGLSLADRFETMTDKEKEAHKKRMQAIMTRVRIVIEKSICPSIEEFEKRNKLARGTYNYDYKKCDEKVITIWVRNVWKQSNQSYSLDWIVTGKTNAESKIRFKNIPDFEPLEKELHAYIKKYQMPKGYIDTQEHGLNTIYGFLWNEHTERFEEKVVCGIRTIRHDIQVTFATVGNSYGEQLTEQQFTTAKWYPLRQDDIVVYEQTLLNIAHNIQQYA